MLVNLAGTMQIDSEKRRKKASKISELEENKNLHGLFWSEWGRQNAQNQLQVDYVGKGDISELETVWYLR